MGIRGSTLEPKAPSFFFPRSARPDRRHVLSTDDRGISQVRGDHQRRNAVVIGPIHISAEP
jgi:hypothetical protein